MNIEKLVKKHGEEYRKLIMDALAFYEKRKDLWPTTVDPEEFFANVISRASID